MGTRTRCEHARDIVETGQIKPKPKSTFAAIGPERRAVVAFHVVARHLDMGRGLRRDSFGAERRLALGEPSQRSGVALANGLDRAVDLKMWAVETGDGGGG